MLKKLLKPYRSNLSTIQDFFKAQQQQQQQPMNVKQTILDACCWRNCMASDSVQTSCSMLSFFFFFHQTC